MTASPDLIFRLPRLKDGAALYELIEACPPLDLNSSYLYFLISVAFICTFLAGCGKQTVTSNGGAVTAKFASEEIEGDFMTVWGNRFADHMREQTEGKLDITVYPYGSLGATRDINELAQLGVVKFVFSDYAWISSFVPEAQVLALHYVWPRENTAEVLEWGINNGAPMSYGEVYSSLQTGVIDAQVNPLFADYSLKFYEATDYFTQIWAKPFLSIPAVNRKFFDSRPPEEQQAMKDYFRSHIIALAGWIDARNTSDRKKNRGGAPGYHLHRMDGGADRNC